MLKRIQNDKKTFDWVIVTTLGFVILTTLGMFTRTGGYNFFQNYFSEIGMVRVDGEANYLSAVIFFFALGGAGIGLSLFFIAFTQFFRTAALPVRILSWIGSLFGVLAGIGFLGVAFTPADVLLQPHIFFVNRAFQFQALAVLIYVAATFLNRRLPRQFAWIFAAFSIFAVGYVWLLMFGPSGSETATRIQVGGQKIIAYASIITVLIQAFSARKISDSFHFHTQIDTV